MRRLLIATAILMMVPGVAHAGGGGVDTSGCAGYTEGTTLVMQDSCFSGTTHFAPAGTTLTVSNDGQLPHTLTAVDGSFDTGSVTAASSAELTIDEPGIYRVFCSLHGTAQGEGMAGVLVVGEPTPAAVGLPADTSEITDAMTAETDRVMQAIASHQTELRDLNAMDARLLDAVSQLEGDETAPAPQVVTMEGDVDPLQLVVLLVIGLAAGLALSALLTVIRLRIAHGTSTGIERWRHRRSRSLLQSEPR